MKRSIRVVTVTLLLWLVAATVAVASSSPSEVVRGGIHNVLAVVQDTSLDQVAKREKMRDLIARHFDFDTMSRSILARNWKKASGKEKERFIALFQTLLENTYMTAIESYTSEQVQFGKERIKGKRAVVPVSIVLKTGAAAPLRFKLRHRKGEWAVYDVVIEGVSLVNNFRSSFRSIVRREGIAGLLERLEKKVGRAES